MSEPGPDGDNQEMARTHRPIPARVRILAAMLAVACVGLAVVGSITFLVQRDRVLDEVDARLLAQIDRLSAMAGTADPDDDSDTETAGERIDIEEFSDVDDYLHAVVSRLVPARHEASLAIVDGAARYRPATLSGFDISRDDELIDRAVTETEASGDAVLGTATTESGSLRYIAIPVEMPGDPQSGVYLRAVDLEAELAPVTAAIITYGIAAGVVLLAVGVVGWGVTGRLLSPIRRLREAAEGITLADLSPRLPANGNDDISDLTRTVNSMLDRLEDSVDGQRRLLDDVRHELKTPITIVRGHLELMDPLDPHDVATTREIGIAELDRMTRLVEDIDLLATVESDSYTMMEVDIEALTARMGELVAVIPGHRWFVEPGQPGTIVGDPDRLLQAWLQLADNAAKYTATGSSIEIGGAVDDAGAILWVRDHGPGIPVDSRERIFHRFDRASGRRTVGGSGLGLAIVEAIAKGHGGRCDVSETPGGGATFTLRLPSGATAAPRPAEPVVADREGTP